jgi:hypothetical protein
MWRNRPGQGRRNVHVIIEACTVALFLIVFILILYLCGGKVISGG